jgi:catechol 2,3-dioxygenase-like lactoylglutathione lyase family enzyme
MMRVKIVGTGRIVGPGRAAPSGSAGSVRRVAGRVHHSAICAHDVEASLHFYRDGLGLDVLMDETFGGDWPALFDAGSSQLRSVFLGDPDATDGGIVELVAFEGGMAEPPTRPAEPAVGFFLLSFYVDDVDTVLGRLAHLGLGGPPRRIEQPAPVGRVVKMATVRDPDDVVIELIGR